MHFSNSITLLLIFDFFQTSYLADRPPSYESSCEEFSPPPHQTTAPRATRPTKLVTTRPSNHSNSRSSSHSKTRSTIHSTTHSITQSTTRPSTTSTTRFTIPPTIRRPIRFTFRPNIVVVRAAQVNFTSALILSCFVYFCCGMLFGLVAFILACKCIIFAHFMKNSCLSAIFRRQKCL